MVLEPMMMDEEFKELEDHAASMLQNKALIQNNVISKRKEQLKHWENSEMNLLCSKRHSSHQSKVKFQDRDIFLSACQSGDEEEVEELLRKGSDINVSSIDGVTALHQAVIDGNIEIVRFLVTHGAEINAQDNEGWTPLHAAVCCGNLNIAKFLYEHGADLTFVNSDRELPIDLAENDEMRAYLEQEMQKKGVDEQKAREKEFNVMLEDCNSWIQSGQYIDKPHPKTGATALHVAASKGYNKLIGMLIRAGANVNGQDFEGWTPLHAAAHWGEKDACRILMENGASLDALTYTGHSVFAVADKSIEEYLFRLKEKFNDIRSSALQHQQQGNGILQDASNLSKESELADNNSVKEHERIGLPSGLHGAEKLQSAAIRRISSGEKLAMKRKDVESDENLVVNAVKRLSPPVPAERQSLLRRDEMNGVTTKNDSGKRISNENTTLEQAAPIFMDDEDEESEWTEVTATPSSSCSAPAPAVKTEFHDSNKSSDNGHEMTTNNPKGSFHVTDTTTEAAALVPILERKHQNGDTAASADECSQSVGTTTSQKRPKTTGDRNSANSTSKEESCTRSSSSSTREGSHSSSASSYSSDRSNTGSAVSSIKTTSRSVTPKDNSSSLYSSDQSIQCTVTVAQPTNTSGNIESSSSSSSITSSTTTNHSGKSQGNHKSAVIRAAEETVKRLRQQLPTVGTGIDRAKSQSVDYGKPTIPTELPLKSPPASAPLVQSARLFWNSIGNNSGAAHPNQMPQQNHPQGSTQLHQQQYNRSRQRFVNAKSQSSESESSASSQSPFAFVAGENGRREKIFKRGESLKIAVGMSSLPSGVPSVPQHLHQRRLQQQKLQQERLMNESNNQVTAKTSSAKNEEFLFGNAVVGQQAKTLTLSAPIATITSASNTASESQSCSSITPSPSPSPIINSPFVTIRKHSCQQPTPPTQPTSQKESESERKAKSKLKRSTRRSTQGVTLEQLGEATGRLHAQNHHYGQGKGESNNSNSAEERIQQVNAKFNKMMEQKVDPQLTVDHQLHPPGSPGCSSASSSSAYLTASNSRHNATQIPHSSATAEIKLKNGPNEAEMPIANFSSTALLIDELNKYKQLYEKERNECERLRQQVQELSADARLKASNSLKTGWRPGATLIQRAELPSGITFSTVTRPVVTLPSTEEKETINGANVDERQSMEKRIAQLESELEKAKLLRSEHEKLKSENLALVRVLAKLSNK